MINITKAEAKVIIEALWTYINNLTDNMHNFPQFSENNNKEIANARLIVKRIEVEFEND